MFGMQFSLVLFNVFGPDLVQVPEARNFGEEWPWDSAERVECKCVDGPNDKVSDYKHWQEPKICEDRVQQHCDDYLARRKERVAGMKVCK